MGHVVPRIFGGDTDSAYFWYPITVAKGSWCEPINCDFLFLGDSRVLIQICLGPIIRQTANTGNDKAVGAAAIMDTDVSVRRDWFHHINGLGRSKG